MKHHDKVTEEALEERVPAGAEGGDGDLLLGVDVDDRRARLLDGPDHRVPAVLEYLPYRKDDATAWQDSTRHRYFAGCGYASVRVDLRGSGDSGRPDTIAAYALDTVMADILAVADAAGAKRFHLWGFGHGASIGRYLAVRSDCVISAVLVGMDMGPTLSGPIKDAIAAMRAKWQPVLEGHKAGTLDLKTLSIGDRDA